MLSKHEGQVNAGKRCLEINHLTVPFSKEEQFLIPPNTRQIIYARVLNEEEEAGFVPLQNLGPGLLFGNFVATNKEGKAYALCYNTSDETVAINTPSVTLEPYEYIREKDELFDEDSNNGYEEVELERANVFTMDSEEE